MSYAIFRMEKMKSTVIDKCQRHNQRENKNYSNQDIDKTKSAMNYDLVNDDKINYRLAIDSIISKRRKSTKALRKDAIISVECLFTSDKDFFERIGVDETRRYFETALDFMKSEFGEENIVYANVHMDERTPHMHANFIPLTSDGRLSAKDMVGGKKQLTIFQNKFCKYMQDNGFDVERGISAEQTNLKHKKTQEYKKESYREVLEAEKRLQELQNNIKHLEEKKQNLESFLEDQDDEKVKVLQKYESEIEKLEERDELKNTVITKNIALRKVLDDVFYNVLVSLMEADLEKYKKVNKSISDKFKIEYENKLFSFFEFGKEFFYNVLDGFCSVKFKEQKLFDVEITSKSTKKKFIRDLELNVFKKGGIEYIIKNESKNFSDGYEEAQKEYTRRKSYDLER
ncbi:MobV family relaxase [Peptacetobacter hominis]|nr:MobV family relaxase [Peptacetobacter hominis]